MDEEEAKQVSCNFTVLSFVCIWVTLFSKRAYIFPFPLSWIRSQTCSNDPSIVSVFRITAFGPPHIERLGQISNCKNKPIVLEAISLPLTGKARVIHGALQSPLGARHRPLPTINWSRSAGSGPATASRWHLTAGLFPVSEGAGPGASSGWRRHGNLRNPACFFISDIEFTYKYLHFLPLHRSLSCFGVAVCSSYTARSPTHVTCALAFKLPAIFFPTFSWAQR